MNPTTDTVLHPPSIPRGADPSHTMSRAEVEALVDQRLRSFADDQRRIGDEQRAANVRQRMMTYGVSGVAGLAAGVGLTLLVQRVRRGRGPMKP